MKILILSCNTGEGHNSAGKAVMEAALLRGHEVEFMDLMLLGGKTVSHMVGGAYISMSDISLLSSPCFTKWED